MKKTDDGTLIVKFFKNKTQMIIYTILFIIFMAGFIYFGSKDYTTDILDSERFVQEHVGANANNVFKYINATEAFSYLKEDDALLFVGIKNSEYVTFYANILDNLAKEMNIKEIKYYDMTEDRSQNNATYESIVNILKDQITYLDDGTADLYGPTLIIKKEGIITLFDDELSFRKGNLPVEEYYNKYEANLIKITLETALKDYLERK